MRLDGRLFRDLMLTHPGRQFFRWWRAMRTPPSEIRSGSLASGDGTYVYEEVEWAAQRPMIVFDSTTHDRTFRDTYGRLEEGSISLVYAPDESDIAQDDRIMPWGVVGDGSDAPARSVLEIVERGKRQQAGTGTVTLNDDLDQATFTHSQASILRYGDILVAGGGKFVVGALTSSTVATLIATIAVPRSTPTAAMFQVGRDALVHKEQVTSIDRVLVSGQPSMLAQGRCHWDAETESVFWEDATALSNAVAYSVRYRAVPTYVIKSASVRIPGLDYGPIPGRGVEGMLHQAMGSIVVPETQRGL